MYWYAVQSIGGNEEKSRSSLLKQNPAIKTFLPQRELLIRRRGAVRKEVKPLFAGYFFIQVTEPLTRETASKLIESAQTIGGKRAILKILGDQYEKGSDNTTALTAISKEEIKPILSLNDGKEIISQSKFIKEGGKVKIISGPLKGKEAIIRKVNPRKKRITIDFYILGEKRSIDLAGEMVNAE